MNGPPDPHSGTPDSSTRFDVTGRRPHGGRNIRLRLLRLWLAYWVGIFVATHLPITAKLPVPVRGGDKVAHFLAYALLTLLGGWFLCSRSVRPHAFTFAVWGAVYAAYGAVDELLQPFVHRTSSWGDWVADLLGVGVVTAYFVLSGGSSQRPQAGDNVTIS